MFRAMMERCLSGWRARRAGWMVQRACACAQGGSRAGSQRRRLVLQQIKARQPTYVRCGSPRHAETSSNRKASQQTAHPRESYLKIFTQSQMKEYYLCNNAPIWLINTALTQAWYLWEHPSALLHTAIISIKLSDLTIASSLSGSPSANHCIIASGRYVILAALFIAALHACLLHILFITLSVPVLPQEEFPMLSWRLIPECPFSDCGVWLV